MSEPYIVTVVAVRGFGQNTVAERLMDAAKAYKRGRLPDPVTQIMQVDPGGGGGPCAPQWVDVPVFVAPAGLPEAQPRDD